MVAGGVRIAWNDVPEQVRRMCAFASVPSVATIRTPGIGSSFPFTTVPARLPPW